MSTNEIKVLEDLQDTLCMYQLTKHVFNHDDKHDKSVVLLDLHQFMILWQTNPPEKSEVVYLQVLDAVAESSMTCIAVSSKEKE